MSIKNRISSPLEAGPSILDAHHLPPTIIPALEYTSSRLAKKSLHLTLVVARRDYQLPFTVPPSPTVCTPAVPPSPLSKLAFGSASMSALRQLVSRASSASLASQHSAVSTPSLSALSSPTFSPLPSAGLESPRWRWPQTPSTPVSLPPMTPSSSASGLTFASSSSTAAAPGGFGMRLIHASHLCSKAEKVLRSTLARAESRFGLAPGSLGSSVTSPQACGLSSQLYNSSVIQNEVLFQSDGLSLLALDRLYSLKSALSSYTKSRSPLRLEDAVDELRRLVLANNGAQVSKSDLLRCYDWLSINHAAIGELDHMYRRAYGGPSQIGGVSGLQSFRDREFHEPVIRADDEGPDGWGDEGDEEEDMQQLDIAIRLMQPPKPPSPRAPLLKIQTTFVGVAPSGRRFAERGGQADEEDGDRTARPVGDTPVLGPNRWKATSIDQLLTARTSVLMEHGPVTPKGYDDISPITRGEWGFMMGRSGLNGKKAPVETF